MTDTLLATKFFVPPPKTNLVHRQRLLDRLDESVRDGKRLILISTPAGYGMTTLLGEWVQRSNYSKAWISLDEGDNDPVKFMTYLIYALREIKAGFGETSLAEAGSSQTQISNSQLTALINELVEGRNSRPADERGSRSIPDWLILLVGHNWFLIWK